MLDVYNGVKDDDHQSEAHSSGGGSASSNSARRYRSCTTMRQHPSHATTTTAVATATTTAVATATTTTTAAAGAASTSKYSSVHMSQCSVVVRDLRLVAPLRVTSRQHISPRQWERLKQEQPDDDLSLQTRIKQEKRY